MVQPSEKNNFQSKIIHPFILSTSVTSKNRNFTVYLPFMKKYFLGNIYIKNIYLIMSCSRMRKGIQERVTAEPRSDVINPGVHWQQISDQWAAGWRKQSTQMKAGSQRSVRIRTSRKKQISHNQWSCENPEDFSHMDKSGINFYHQEKR